MLVEVRSLRRNECTGIQMMNSVVEESAVEIQDSEGRWCFPYLELSPFRGRPLPSQPRKWLELDESDNVM